MRRPWWWISVLAATAPVVRAQSWTERIREGQAFCEQKWRRDADGRLEVLSSAAAGAEHATFIPLVTTAADSLAFQNAVWSAG